MLWRGLRDGILRNVCRTVGHEHLRINVIEAIDDVDGNPPKLGPRPFADFSGRPCLGMQKRRGARSSY